MHATLPLLIRTDFPLLRRGVVDTLQIDLGYRCNQSCVHCHVNAGPNRTEEMSLDTIDAVIAFLAASPEVRTLDLTGGAPELNRHFRSLVVAARARGVRVIDRCNLTILEEPGQDGLAEFLAAHGVEVVASMPCYLEDNVDRQRGKGTFNASIRGMQRLNALGYAQPGSSLTLNLVYNPQGASLPPGQEALQRDYKQHNMPIQRFGSMLVSKGQFNSYMNLLRSAHREENLAQVMCRRRPLLRLHGGPGFQLWRRVGGRHGVHIELQHLTVTKGGPRRESPSGPIFLGLSAGLRHRDVRGRAALQG